jgi:hypothetical protein
MWLLGGVSGVGGVKRQKERPGLKYTSAAFS